MSNQTSTPQSSIERIESITYPVPSATRGGLTHTVTRDVADSRLSCSCEARVPCWHVKAVAAGLVRPRVRVMPKPATVKANVVVQRTPTSEIDSLFSDSGRAATAAVALLRAVS